MHTTEAHATEAHLQHHFHDSAQQFDASKIGMWLFLATEILMFGGLFAGYGLAQVNYHEAFKSAHHHLDKVLGTVNTVALLISSFTMVLAVWAAKTNRRKLLIGNLLATIALAAVFMFIKLVFEYPHKYHDGLLPGRFFSYKGEALPGESIFFSFYFMMTGLHGIHVLIGMGLLSWLTVRAIKGDYSSKWYTPVDLVGLYWHLVDMIWIYLFPLMYLVS
jgi:cytochrome c oxidase subunit 3